MAQGGEDDEQSYLVMQRACRVAPSATAALIEEDRTEPAGLSHVAPVSLSLGRAS